MRHSHLERLEAAIARWIELYAEDADAPEEVHSRTVGFREFGALLDAGPPDPVARLLTVALPQGSLATLAGAFRANAAS